MKRISGILILVFLVWSSVAGAQTDTNAWTITGRVATVVETTFPDGNKITAVTLSNIDAEADGNFSRDIGFNCSIYADCRDYLLGSCTKHTITATLTTSEGTTTTKTSECLNHHYADCWEFTGYQTPQRWATGQTQRYGCNF